MKPYRAAVAAFVIGGVLLFGLALFLIGDQHKAFSHQMTLYTDIANVNGLAPGAHVRVSGYEAGQIANIAIPDRPEAKFRLRLKVDEKLKNLIREDSVVTVETDGLVGDKFLLVHNGSENGRQIHDGATLPSKEPIELSAIMQQVSGTIDQANATLGDVRSRLDGTLDAITRTVNNTNGIVTSIRRGNGPVGALLNDPQITQDLKATVANTRQATANLDQVSVQAGQLMTDIQSRGLVDKADQTIDNVRHASAQLDQTSQQLNTNLERALAPDASGRTAADNLQGTLSSVNVATSNMAEDTEALKHEFFFRGFFRKRGFYSLQDLTPEQYRDNAFFRAQGRARGWLQADQAFRVDGNGHQTLTAVGEQQIDAFVGSQGSNIVNAPLIIEGYSTAPQPAEQLVSSRDRAVLVRSYVERHFHLKSSNVGTIALQSMPPPNAGKSTWDGASLLILAKAK